ncbi:MAG TPA: ABC transporter permease [Acidimicrobiales bacterium]|nr:ABC transporter permease [Acidimicrobiales bacterium]
MQLRDETGTAVGAVGAPAAVAAPGWARSALWRNPWRHAWFLEGFTWLYLAWSILPIALAVLFSFNSGKSQSVWQGFSLRWYTSDPLNSVLHNPQLHQAVLQTLWLSLYTTLITVPLGVAFGIGIDRWRTRTSTAFNFVMIFSFVVPELIFGVALFFVFTALFTSIHLGTLAEVLGLVTWNLSWPAIIVRARLVSIGNQYEEAAADLGASRLEALRRVLLPMLMPAIFASAVLVFAGVVDDFVIVDLLSSTGNTQPMSVIIYSNTHGGNGGPALNALATLMLLFSFVVATLGYVGYRFMTRGERTGRQETLTSIAGM